MELSSEQIDFIHQDIQEKGITMPELADSLTDHICCALEAGLHQDFDSAYSTVLAEFGEADLANIQTETIYLLTYKRQIIMKKLMFILAYVAIVLCGTGILFKIQHWPGANMMTTLGILLLNFGYLPLYFHDRYKKAISQ